MFSQASVCPSPGGGGDRCHTKCNMGPSQNIYPPPPRTRSECLPPLWDQVRMSTPSPPGTRSECLPPPPGPGQNIYPPPPGTRSECLPPPPLGPGQNVYPLPPHLRLGHSTPKLHAGGRYASYWNASLFTKKTDNIKLKRSLEKLIRD